MLISSFSFYLIGFLKKSLIPPAFVLFSDCTIELQDIMIQYEELKDR